MPDAQKLIQMEAALKMVLMFHSADDWTPLQRNLWLQYQRDAGVTLLQEEATSKSLCNVVRYALGVQTL